MEEKKRRRPSVEKRIGGIAGDEYRVRVNGIVVERDEGENSAIIDDGTGRVNVFFTRREDFDLASEEKLVRVIGKVIKDEELAIDVEIVQDMQSLDVDLYEKVRKIEGKGG